MELAFTVERLEFYLLIIARMSAFVISAPFLNNTNVPRQVKAGLSVFLGILAATSLAYVPLEYTGVIGFAGLIIKEVIVGLSLGYIASVCQYIVNFSGQMIDMEIGFSMANVMDPSTKIQSTVTGNFYSYMVMFMMLITNMHYYVIEAIIDSFKLVPVGQVVLHGEMYQVVVKFIVDYFIIGFRIILPIFASILLINIVLGIMVRVAPQMNMFVIGMQIKIFAGLFILLLVVELIPTVADFIFEEMKTMLQLMIETFI